jgi:DNA-binding MarR family transcriptional regulator
MRQAQNIKIGTRHNITELLHRNPGTEYTTADIARRFGLTPAGAQTNLYRLDREGLVRRRIAFDGARRHCLWSALVPTDVT